MSQCDRVAEKRRELTKKALEQLKTETFGGYQWDEISKNFRRKLLNSKVKFFLRREKNNLKPVEPRMIDVELIRKRESRKQEQRQQQLERAKQAIASSKLRVAVDCQWGETQGSKQNVLLVSQLMDMDRYNRLADQPAKLYLTGLREGDRIHQEVYRRSKNGLNTLFSDITPLSHTQFFSKEEIVYLSPDATQTLTTIDPTKVYIIGGLVDLGDGCFQTFEKAEDEGVVSMKIPVTDYMNLSEINGQRCILCLNQVLAILLDLYVGKEWTHILSRHVPSRKAHFK